jgi:hypothetical protein
MAMLPEVRDCAAEFGMTRPDLFGREIPILGVAGDQQAATDRAGLLPAGHDEIHLRDRLLRASQHRRRAGRSNNRLLTTIAYQLDGKPTYALEGSIFIAGAVVQWLRDGMKIIREAGRPSRSPKRGRGAGGRAGARLHRARRALLERRVPGRDLRAHPQLGARGARARRARKRGLPDARPPRGDAADWTGAEARTCCASTAA